MNTLLSNADVRALNEIAEKNVSEQSIVNTILSKSKVVDEKELPETTVRINSLVTLWHSFLNKVVKIRIVLPQKADLKSRNVSVFSPISLAILGKNENESVDVLIGGIKKELKILKVMNRETNKRPILD